MELNINDGNIVLLSQWLISGIPAPEHLQLAIEQFKRKLSNDRLMAVVSVIADAQANDDRLICDFIRLPFLTDEALQSTEMAHGMGNVKKAQKTNNYITLQGVSARLVD